MRRHKLRRTNSDKKIDSQLRRLIMIWSGLVGEDKRQMETSLSINRIWPWGEEGQRATQDNTESSSVWKVNPAIMYGRQWKIT